MKTEVTWVTKPIFDPTFNIKAPSLSIANLLGDFYTEKLSSSDIADQLQRNLMINSYPWYNGRERAIAISVSHFLVNGKQFNIVFGESRNSDAIFIDSWEEYTFGDAPTHENKGYEKAYSHRKTYSYNQPYQVAEEVKKRIEEFIIDKIIPGLDKSKNPEKEKDGGKLNKKITFTELFTK